MIVPSAILTVADVLNEFGPIPISRIRTQPPPGDATEQHVVDIETHENRLFELYDGILIEKTMGHYESYLAMVIAAELQKFVVAHDLGYIVGADGMVKLFPGEVRIPDTAFISWDRLGQRQVPREPIPLLVPDLIVEVISKGNTPREMDRKLKEYFDAGARLVWYVYPETSVVRVFNASESFFDLTDADVLDGGEILPGFTLPLAKVFTKAD